MIEQPQIESNEKLDSGKERILDNAVSLIGKWDGSILGLHNVVSEEHIFNPTFFEDFCENFSANQDGDNQFRQEFLERSGATPEIGRKLVRVIKIYLYILEKVEKIVAEDPEGFLVRNALDSYLSGTEKDLLGNGEGVYFDIFKMWDKEFPGSAELMRRLIEEGSIV